MRTIKTLAAAAIVLLTLTGIVSCHVSIWNECRAEHSWLYCMRVLGSR